MILGHSMWKKEPLKEVFTISKYGDVENVRALKDGNTKYISTSRYNNGLSRMVNNTKYRLEKGNCITVGIDGSFSTFYQPDDFIRTTNIAILRCVEMDKYVGLFFSTIIKCALSKYYYGVKIKKGNTLADTEIYVPITIDGLIDWNFIRQFTKKIYFKTSKRFRTKIKVSKNTFDFSLWKKIKLIDVFNYERGQRYRKEDHKNGVYPYICSSELNNGIDCFVTPGKRSKVYRDCLTIANSGSRGVVFFHEGDFIASDHVTVLWRKDGVKITKNVGLFLKPIIEKNSSRFLFNKEINEKTISEIEIFLPYKDDDIDWNFMESYIGSLPNSDLLSSCEKKD